MVRVQGYPRTGRTFPTKAEAHVWVAQTETAARGRTLATAGKMTFGQMLDAVLPRLTNPTTAIFAYWREAFGNLRVDRVTPDLIAKQRDRLHGAECRGHGHKSVKPRSAATVRNYMIELSRAFTVAVRELRILAANPCSAVKKPPPSRQIVRWLTDDEREQLLDACRTSESSDLYLFVLLALTTGARKGEIAGLEWSQVDLRRRWATFPTTKNGDARGIPLVPAVVDLLRQRPRDGLRVFGIDITKAWHTAVARAGIENFRFHDLRHSCASGLVQNGANLAEVATLLGHKSLQMTLRYSHVSNDGTTRLVDRVWGAVA
jgi:integrase